MRLTDAERALLDELLWCQVQELRRQVAFFSAPPKAVKVERKNRQAYVALLREQIVQVQALAEKLKGEREGD